jgi:hypothetical protein
MLRGHYIAHRARYSSCLAPGVATKAAMCAPTSARDPILNILSTNGFGPQLGAMCVLSIRSNHRSDDHD